MTPTVPARSRVAALVACLVVVAGACTDSASTATGTPDTREPATSTTGPPATTTTTTTSTTAPATTTTSTTTTEPPATTTTTPTTTTEPPATTTTTAAPPCSGGSGAGLPASATGVTRATGDFDGDGARDDLVVYGGQSPTPWHARVVLAYGYAADIPIGNDVVGRALGGFDIDGGEDEAFVVVGAGAATTLVSILTMRDCDLAVVQMPGGFDAVFPVGATVGAQSGLECFPGDGIAVYEQTTSDGTTYEWQMRRFGLSGVDLVLRATEERTLQSPADDDVIFRVGTFECGPLDL